MRHDRVAGEPRAWNAPRPPAPRVVDRVAAGGVTVGAPLGLIAAGAAAGSPFTGVALALVLVAGVGAAVAYSGRRALRRVAATRVGDDEQPRLRNLARGLASDLGHDPPTLWLIPDDAPNAMVCGALATPAVAVTRGLLQDYTRSELEAVVAHCLVRADGRRRLRAGLAVSLGWLAPAVAPGVGFDDDVRAAALTRYPPALASAIGKAEPRHDRFAPLWFVAAGPPHASRADRREALSEL